ncbi:hypothetical protein JCM31271_31600 [Halorubrum trueperi]
MLAVEVEAGLVAVDHLGRSDAVADIDVFTPACTGGGFGGVPRRRRRKVQIEQLVVPVGDLPVGQPALVPSEGGLGLSSHAERALGQAVRMGGLDSISPAFVVMEVVAGRFDGLGIGNLLDGPGRDINGLGSDRRRNPDSSRL